MSDTLVILTGAGISAESGLGTFRDTDGIWSKFDWRKLASPEGFAEDPEAVHAFYNARRQGLLEAAPNAAHRALAELEARWPGELLLVTQNIDDLHERGGSTDVVHMHGELLKARCEACEAVFGCRADLSVSTPCPDCSEAGHVRPHVVWFGEMPLALEQIYETLLRCDLFVAIGTSGAVYPAAGFVQEARLAGARTVELSLEPGEVSAAFDERIYAPATEATPAFVERLLAGRGT